MKFYNLKEINVVILCGGLGKRLRPVLNDRPKVLAEINGKAFLEILLDNLLDFGFKKFILSAGYQREKIVNHFEKKERKAKYILEFSKEETPLGTGGALKKAEALIESDTFLVMNGDTFCDVDFNKLLNFHINKRAILTMVLVCSKKKDYGYVKLDNSCRITDFREKPQSGKESMVNAGIYLMEKDILRKLPEGNAFSLEYDFFPRLTEAECYGYLTENELLDIGTPERYEKAKHFFRNKISFGANK